MTKRPRFVLAIAAIGALGLSLLLLPTPGVAQTESTSGTELGIGPGTGPETSAGDNSITFVSGTTTGTSGVTTFSGTKQQIGSLTFYNFRSSDGTRRG